MLIRDPRPRPPEAHALDEFETISRLAIERGMATKDQIAACRDASRLIAAKPATGEVSAVSILLDRRVLTARQLERLRADTAVLSKGQLALPSLVLPGASVADAPTRSTAAPSMPASPLSPAKAAAGEATTARSGAKPVSHADRGLEGRVLGGKFQLGRKLGQGGMGAVYLARQTNLGREVAIKVLPPEVSDAPELIARFTREARLSAQLSHPNVVQVHDIEVDQATGLHYLVMERVDGESLAERVRRDGPLDWRVAVGLVIQAARGLGAAHAAGVIHRDVKPANLMLARDGTVKVMDFGLSRAFEADGQLSRTGQVLGTPHYMSPEQARGERDLDARADVFSLGATLYCLLTGRPPFRGPSTTVILYNVIYEPPEPLDEARPGLPAALGRCVLRTLAKAREERPADMGALVAELERLGERTGLRERVEELATATLAPWSGLHAAPAARRRVLAGAGVAVAIAAVIYAAWPTGAGTGGDRVAGSDAPPAVETSPRIPIDPPRKPPVDPPRKPPVDAVAGGPTAAERAIAIDDQMDSQGHPPEILATWREQPQLVPPAPGSADERALEASLIRLLLVMAGHGKPESVADGGTMFGDAFPRSVVIAGLGHAAARGTAAGEPDPDALALFERGLPLGVDAQLAFGIHPELERVRTTSGWEYGIVAESGASPSVWAWRRAGRTSVAIPGDAERKQGLSAVEWRARLLTEPADGTLAELARRALAAALLADPSARTWAGRLAERRAQVRASTTLGGTVELDLDGDRVGVTGWQALVLRVVHTYVAPQGESAKAIAAAVAARGRELLEPAERRRWGRWADDRIDEMDGKGRRGPPPR